MIEKCQDEKGKKIREGIKEKKRVGRKKRECSKGG